ncbi:class I SAM-dependent methyltransferase [Flavobacteriaceae bacterium TP-CH-4]|uniref:Class I SAM-dependent methyltransferase n=1 Tax=Pelagihabitans pacificus TaxID=2696054 RepID=A0A967E495_9FLAO|nr:class I SAM-dependent methyltransferase [Pelagihabitans pacificus]NHF58157.1 class I SAM-dependent methyltransferase [Pelagihabitans pacificus]
MEDIFGTALLDYQKGAYTEDLITFSSLGEEDVMPLPYLFRNFQQMPPLEQKALKGCEGRILDIGCGAGSHSLVLQERGLDVTAIDHSPGAIETCRIRGVRQTVLCDICSYEGQRFDTLLMLMNGIGIVGTLAQLGPFLDHLKTLLRPGGQLLLDSSDIIYMFDEGDKPQEWEHYYGEVTFTIQYKGMTGPSFPWLYVSYGVLEEIAKAHDFSCELVGDGEHYDYLARLSPRKY